MLIPWKLINAAQLITSNKNAFIAFIFPSFQVKTANYSSAPMQGRKKTFLFWETKFECFDENNYFYNFWLSENRFACCHGRRNSILSVILKWERKMNEREREREGGSKVKVRELVRGNKVLREGGRKSNWK